MRAATSDSWMVNAAAQAKPGVGPCARQLLLGGSACRRIGKSFIIGRMSSSRQGITMLALRHLRSGLAAAIIGASVLPAAGSAERCQSLINEFNQLVDTGTENEAQQLIDKIATSAECGRYQVPAQRRL